MEHRTPIYILASWAGTLATWITAHELIAILATACALVSSALAALAALYKIDIRREELRRLQIQSSEELAFLCASCREGRPPPHCPIPPEDRPENCPKATEP